MNVGKGEMTDQQALKRVRRMVSRGEIYAPAMLGILRRLHAPEIYEMAELLVSDQKDHPERYTKLPRPKLIHIAVQVLEEREIQSQIPQQVLVVAVSGGIPFSSAKLLTRPQLTIYNDGNRVYVGRQKPELRDPFLFSHLSYERFCGDGEYFRNIRIQHLGHSHGLLGGIAHIRITSCTTRWDIHCEAERYYYLYQSGSYQQLYTHDL